MTQSIQSQNASSAPTKAYETISRASSVAATTSRTHCQMFSFEAYTTSNIQIPVKHSSISNVIEEFSSRENGTAHLENGRRWIAESFYRDDGETIRSLRLRKGWSQSQLAEQLNTSQSHVARIERGSENVTIDTCRRLSVVLGVDLNQLNQALMIQEQRLREKQK